MKEKIKAFFGTRKYMAVLLVFVPLYTNYFILSHLRDPIWTVHSPVDDIIPFTPAFIYFYFLWYLYISLPLIWMAVSSRTDLYRMVFFLVIGMVICHLFYIIIPNQIDFRGAAEEAIANKRGFTAFLVKFIYATDQPHNVFPSMHCFESIAIHITLCHSETGRKHWKWLYPVSLFVAIMICISTTFIKQHSFYDVVAGVGLALIILPIVYIPKWKFLQKKESESR